MFFQVDPTFSQVWTRTSAPLTNWVSLAVSSDGARLVAAVGQRSGPFWGASAGPIYISSDSGATWTLSSAPIATWNQVASSADGTKLAAAGGRAIYTSTNSGVTWIQTSASNTNSWSSVAYSADGSKLAAVADGVYISTNSGTAWIKTAAPGTLWSSVACSADGAKLVGMAGSGDVYISTDSGAAWRASATFGERWVAVACSADGNRIAAVSGFLTYLSSDSGATWSLTNKPNWYSTCVASSADGATTMVAGLDWVHSWYSDAIYTSSDYGATWVSYSVPGKWSAVASSADGSRLFAAEGSGGIWAFQSIPSPRLHLSPSRTNLVLSWTIPPEDFVLQQSSDLTGNNWSDVPATPALNLTSLQYQLALPLGTSSRFFRLKH